MAEMGLFPDAALILNVEDSDVIARLLPPKLDKWRVKRDKRLEKKRKKKEKAQKKRVNVHLFDKSFLKTIVYYKNILCEI